MAKIEATREGAEALRKLATDLQNSSNDLEQCSGRLKSTVTGLNDLGDFASKIMDIVEQVVNAQSQGRESVDGLSQKLNTLAGRVEEIASNL